MERLAQRLDLVAPERLRRRAVPPPGNLPRPLSPHPRRRALPQPDVIGLRLYVEDANERAQRTYQALGMKPGGYSVYEDLWIPERELSVASSSTPSAPRRVDRSGGQSRPPRAACSRSRPSERRRRVGDHVVARRPALSLEDSNQSFGALGEHRARRASWLPAARARSPPAPSGSARPAPARPVGRSSVRRA